MPIICCLLLYFSTSKAELLFPFDESVNASELINFGATYFHPVETIAFPFLGRSTETVFISPQGLISAGAPCKADDGCGRSKTACELSANPKRIMAPFWSDDIDLTAGFGGGVYLRTSGNTADLAIFNAALASAKATAQLNEPLVQVLIVTWAKVTFSGRSDDKPTDTFQAAIGLGASESFAVFSYERLEWASEFDWSAQPFVGLDYGNGNCSKLEFSGTANVTSLARCSSAGIPVPGQVALRTTRQGAEKPNRLHCFDPRHSSSTRTATSSASATSTYPSTSVSFRPWSIDTKAPSTSSLQPSSSAISPADSEKTSLELEIGVGVGAGSLALFAITLALCWRRRRAKDGNAHTSPVVWSLPGNPVVMDDTYAELDTVSYGYAPLRAPDHPAPVFTLPAGGIPPPPSRPPPPLPPPSPMIPMHRVAPPRALPGPAHEPPPRAQPNNDAIELGGYGQSLAGEDSAQMDYPHLDEGGGTSQSSSSAH